ncbi:MAG TPA: glutathione S-transferase family protein [Ramlibacter sp.]|jgi:glutathione S-transferase|nr:glutathione S-transferase family protein [Ramlibacter sp.]
MSTLTLVSHALCPYVQRAAIVLAEKGVSFERRWVDLADKPAWFRAVSPLGKTPVLLVGEEAVFESAVICEYLDETRGSPLHPQDPLQKARERGWMEFGSGVLNTIWGFYTAADEGALESQRAALRAQFVQVEAALDPQGPWFGGERFGMVDAVFAPVFRYFEVFERIGETGMFVGLPKVGRWRAALAQRLSVRGAVLEDYSQRLENFLLTRGSALSRRIAQPVGVRGRATQPTGA